MIIIKIFLSVFILTITYSTIRDFRDRFYPEFAVALAALIICSLSLILSITGHGID